MMRFRFCTLLFSVMILILTAVSLAITQDHSIGYEISSFTDFVGHFQNVTVHEGDLIIGDNATFLIENCQFNLTGKLIIEDRAEVVICNATFISNWNTSEVPEKFGTEPWRTRHIIVENQAKLTVLNSELILSATYPWHGEYHSVLLYGHATANITKSKVTYVNGPGDCIYAYNDSKLWMKDVTLSAFTPETPWYEHLQYPKCYLLAYYRSEAEVQNSTIDRAYVNGNCTVHFFDSNAEYFEGHSSRINITDSSMSQLMFWGSNVWLTNTTIGTLTSRTNSKIRLIHCVAEEVSAGDKSEVWLLDSSVKELHGKSRVWVVWDWPLFGQVSIPYTWAPYVVPVIAIALASPLIAIMALLFLRSRAHVCIRKPEVRRPSWFTILLIGLALSFLIAVFGVLPILARMGHNLVGGFVVLVFGYSFLAMIYYWLSRG